MRRPSASFPTTSRRPAGSPSGRRPPGHPRAARQRRIGHTACGLRVPAGDAPGEYKFTPGTPFAFAPRWGEVTPFVLRDSSQFRAGPPFPVGEQRYAEDFNEVKSLGGDGVTTPSARTAEQTEIGLFWIESSPLAWNRIARQISARANLDLHENARLFGLLNMALADGYIGSWEGKYHYKFWRPITAIREADTDGNPDTFSRSGLDAPGIHLSHARPRLGPQRRGRRGGRGPQTVLWHRPRSLQELQHDAAGRAEVHRRDADGCARSAASRKRRTRTAFHGS